MISTPPTVQQGAEIDAPFSQYRRKQIAELRPYSVGDDMNGVSISQEDAKAGSPKVGDMIARNPKNHADQWLVAATYFADNFEPARLRPAEPLPAGMRERVVAVLGPIAAKAAYYDHYKTVESGEVSDRNTYIGAKTSEAAWINSLRAARALLAELTREGEEDGDG